MMGSSGRCSRGGGHYELSVVISLYIESEAWCAEEATASGWPILRCLRMMIEIW